MMGVSFGLNQEARVKQTVAPILTTILIQEVRSIMFSLSLQLIEKIRGETYYPSARCPTCGYKLEDFEIVKGFRSDPLDFNTTCPKCKYRFQPRLICFAHTGIKIELPFICASQVLHSLRSKYHLAPDKISRDYPGDYRSAIVHWGSLTAAFAKININYHFKEVAGWKQKIMPFLGRLPDHQIARAVEVSPSTIRRLRIKNKISACSLTKIAEDQGLI